MKQSLNIILFGETGVGKSSVVNLIAGSQVAQISPDIHACTMSYRHYTHHVPGGISYTIWDTRGLDEPRLGTRDCTNAIEQVYKLIRDLSEAGGIDLLLLCHRAGRITATNRANYRLFYEVLCEMKVPISVVITHLEREARMEDWWNQNVEVFERHKMKVATHACVTGLPGHTKSQESKLAVEKLLGQHDGNGRYNMPSDEWFQRFLQRFVAFPGRPKGLKKEDLETVLRQRCGLGMRTARDIATLLVEGRAECSAESERTSNAQSDTRSKRRRWLFGL